jgi:simple sugar transport system substrate-binding protein
MAQVSRRTLMKGVGAAGTLSMIGSMAKADGKVKVGFIFLGPVGDYGWTWAHNKGREAIDAALGDKVETLYVENVAEDASAVAQIRELANQGCKLIFTCSYGYMEQTLQVAAEFPDVKFEHCTGFKRADNVATYNSKFHEGRAVLGTIAGKMSKSGTLGYLGSYKVPEVVLGVNAFALAAQKQNPAATVKLVLIDSWFDPPKEAAATDTLVNLGCDIVTTHTDSPGPLQILEQKGLYGFGQGADMSAFADAVQAGYKDGSYDIFTGPIFDQDGNEKVKAGEVMTLEQLASIDWFVKGVESAT